MSPNEERLAAEIEQIQKLSKADKNINAEVLINAAFAKAHQEEAGVPHLKRAYAVSLLAPPFGLYYAFKFFLRPEPAYRRQVWICFRLTIVSIAFMWILAKLLFVAAPGLNDLQNINPQDIQSLIQQ